MNAVVELYRTEQGLAIRTIAKDEREFVEAISVALAESAFGQDDMGEVMPYVIDIACKLRGYKAPSVIEERVLICGPGALPADAMLVKANARGVIGAEAVQA